MPEEKGKFRENSETETKKRDKGRGKEGGGQREGGGEVATAVVAMAMGCCHLATPGGGWGHPRQGRR